MGVSNADEADASSASMKSEKGDLVYICYRDHVLFHRTTPITMKTEIREAVGWLVYDCANYIIICWDRNADPPTLKGGDPKASGLVIIRSDIVELRKFKGFC
jgi:hypothetical protein